jgi:outer membrane protein insertion porin family
MECLVRGSVAAVALFAAATPVAPVLAALQLAQVQEGGTIQAVQIEGTERIEPETVRSYLAVQPGDAFNNTKLDQSLKTLFGTGLFADVSLGRDGDTLIVRVVENPIINRVAYEGNSHFDDEKLGDEVQLKPRAVYTRTRVQADVKRLLDLYRRSGRFAATVEPKVIQLPQNRVDLVFEINEGKTTSIRSINFVGNKVFDNGDLEAVISTKESRWYRFLSSDDTYDPDRMTYDRELLRKFYLARGYADFRVVSAVAELTPSRDGFIITFTVDEGERYTFGHIAMNIGLKDLTRDVLEPLLTTHEGDWYNVDEVDNSVNRLTAAVGDRGYAFVDIRPLINRHKEERTLDLTFDIGEGPRVYVERIDVQGNVTTLDKVIRRELTLAEGDAFNTSKVKRSEQNLKNLGFFKNAEVTNVQGSAPDRTVLNVKVEEQSTGEISVGAGYSSAYGLLGNFGIRQRNFLGTGQDVSLQGTLAQYEQNASFSFTEPYFLDRPIAAGFDLFDTAQNTQTLASYDLAEYGLTLRMGFDLYQDLHDTVLYSIRNERITNVISTASLFILEEEGQRTASVIGNTIIYDKRDNRLNPTGGWYVSLDTSYAGLGGNIDYFKPVISGGFYYSIAPKWVAGITGQAGETIGIGEDVTIEDRTFIGGDNLRGFAPGGIGPRDITTRDSLGGNTFYVGSVTLQVPLGLPEELGIGGRVFTDFGSLFGIDLPGNNKINGQTIDRADLVDSHVLRLSSGVGVSWKSPMGPIKIDFGLPILKDHYDERQVVHVSFGTKF